MSIQCDIVLQWSATPAQLTALGSALWNWCMRTAGDSGVYQYLDSDALADLIAGKLPVPGRAPCAPVPRASTSASGTGDSLIARPSSTF